MRTHPFPSLIPVVHGAPLVHRPKQAREDRLTLARISTDCTVGRAFETDMRPVHSAPDFRHSFFERDGRLWVEARLFSPALNPTKLTPDAFEKLLREEAPVDDQLNIAFRRYFFRTPLAPRDLVTGRQLAFEGKRAQGEDLPARGPGLVLSDARERTARELSRFLADEVLVTESAVYVRCDPVVRGSGQHMGGPLTFRVTPERNFEPQLLEDAPIPADGWLSYPATGETEQPRQKGECALALEAEGWLDRHEDADLRILANTLPGWLLHSRGYGTRETEESGVPASLLPGIKADALRGMTGSITLGEAPDVLARFAQALRPHAQHLAERPHSRFVPSKAPYAMALLEHIENSVLPRTLSLPDADVEALSGLAAGF
jgi:hypothetical protein